jgi:hypothetical protein
MANQILPGTGKVRTVKQITATKPFKQPSQVATNSPMGHPARNLGAYAHPPKHRHAIAKAPDVRGRDYRPAAMPKNNLHPTQKSVAGVDQGSSDVKSEGIGPDLGPLLGIPTDYKKKAAKKQMKASKMSGTPFFGGAM